MNRPNDHRRIYRGRKVLVLGASGFIGRWVARYLAPCGAQLVLAVRDRRAARVGEAAIVGVDLAQDGAVSELIGSVRPVITFNLVGYGVDPGERDEELARRINAELVKRICAAIGQQAPADWPGLQLVHAGSALEYGVIPGDLSEDSTPDPTTTYGRTKLQGTEALLGAREKHGVRGVTARLFTVYGAGEHAGRLLPSLLQAAATGDVLPLTEGTQQRDFTYVEDVAEGLVRLGGLTREPHAVFNLATGKLTSVREFVEIASGVLSIGAHRLQCGALPTRKEEMSHSPVNVGRLLDALKWKPATGIAEGIRRTMGARP